MSDQVSLILDATEGFNLLLNNQLAQANDRFKRGANDGNSPYHLAGLGLAKFLQAALGQEDKELLSSLNILGQAETTANNHAQAKRPKSEPPTVYPPGTEFKIIVSDVVVAQALCHILTESTIEFMKAVYKLNRAYKGFSNAYKVVFPKDISENDSLHKIFTDLNAFYLKSKEREKEKAFSAATSTSSSGSGFFGWNTKKRTDLQHLKHSSSTSAIPNLVANLSLDVPSSENLAASAPTSRPPSERGSITPSEQSTLATTADTATSNVDTSATSSLNENSHGAENGDESPSHLVGEDGKEVPEPLWKGDALTTLVISGAAFGFGLFGLIFSILPPRLRKLISWFGFSNSNRQVALKLLTVASATGDDVHGYFASLCLITYYSVILLMSGWQADEEYLLRQTSAVLSRISAKFPDGTLWVLNRAKLRRMNRDLDSAIAILEEALSKESTFREADSLLVFELCWSYLSAAKFAPAARTFLQMKETNSWSHATYVFMSAGSLLMISLSSRTEEQTAEIEKLLEELPSLFNQKRLMGEPPTTEIFITRKLATYKAKHARWVASGRIDSKTRLSDVIRISPASELSLFWNTTGRAPKDSLQHQIDLLSAFSPPPRFGPGAPSATLKVGSTTSLATSALSTFDLDTLDEIATRDLLLGNLYRCLGSFDVARQFHEAVLAAAPRIQEEKWLVPFSTLDLAVLDAQEAERDSELPDVKGDKSKEKKLWKERAAKVEKRLDELLQMGEYDLKGRVESRGGMLRQQIAEKLSKLKA
ncbi:hypothetical protein T439DRAFT_323696 [Meredithblackwellia eburnea MCA 4105]